MDQLVDIEVELEAGDDDDDDEDDSEDDSGSGSEHGSGSDEDMSEGQPHDEVRALAAGGAGHGSRAYMHRNMSLHVAYVQCSWTSFVCSGSSTARSRLQPQSSIGLALCAAAAAQRHPACSPKAVLDDSAIQCLAEASRVGHSSCAVFVTCWLRAACCVLQEHGDAGGGEGGMGDAPSLTEDSEEDHTGGAGGGHLQCCDSWSARCT
jgi:hypothetical protein